MNETRHIGMPGGDLNLLLGLWQDDIALKQNDDECLPTSRCKVI